MKTYVQTKKRRRGFTLGEVVMTVAIVGTLTAVAVPNYMRIKMNVNMEMVKQQLKKMGTHMNELYNQNHEFPEDILNLGNTDDEAAVTASLHAIDSKGYTTDGYSTATNRTYYQFYTCPRTTSAGDRCFILDSLGITEDIALALAIFAAGEALYPEDFTPLTGSAAFRTKSFPNAQKVLNFLLYMAATTETYYQSLISGPEAMYYEDYQPAAMLQLSNSNATLLKELLATPSFVRQLTNAGVTVFYSYEPDLQPNAPHMVGFKYDSTKFNADDHRSY